MTAPKGDSASLADLQISGLRLAGRHTFESRDPPRSRSPPAAHPRATPSVPFGPPAAPKPTPADPNPWSRPSRIPHLSRRPPTSVRLRELRSRFLGRKFLALWRTKTFGRVTPSAALAFRRQQVLRAAFSRWFDLYWTERKEWRLRLRAECHDRLRLWQKTFGAWKAFTLKRRVSRAHSDLARAHARGVLRRKVLAAWRREAGLRAARRKLVLAFRAEWLLRKCLRRWRAAAAAAVEERRSEREGVRRAEAWREAVLKAKTMRALQDYVGRRRHQKVMKARAARFRNLTLKAAVLITWEARWRRARELCAFEGRIAELAVRSRCRWALQAMKLNVALVRQGQVRLATAVLHDENRRKRKAFAALRAFVRMRRNAEEMKAEAEQHHRKALLLRSLRIWQKRFEFEEEARLEPQSAKARRLRRTLLLRSAFSTWQAFLLQRRASRARSLAASRHFSCRVLPRCFAHWRAFVACKRRREAQAARASDFHRRRVLASALATWRWSCEAAARHRYQFRVAVLHERRVVLARSLRLWRERADFSLWERHQLLSAARFHRDTCLARYLRVWRERAALRVREADLTDLADSHYRQLLLRNTTAAWVTWARRRRKRREAEEEAETWRRKRRKKAVFGAWKELVRRKRASVLEAERLARQNGVARLAAFWPKFVAAVRQAKKRRLALEAADAHFRRVLLFKVLFAWRTYAAQRSSKRAQTLQQLHNARLQLSRSLARRALATWLGRREERILDRLAMTRARLHHEAKVRKSVLSAWRQEVVRRQESRLQEHQAAWFDRVRLLGGAFRKWQDGLMVRRRQRNLEVIAVLHWARSLQQRYFQRWRIFVCCRRIELQRQEDALKRYRSHILHEGVRLWLLSAANLRSERHKAHLSANLRLTGRGWEAARRCAERWRRRTEESREKALRTRPAIRTAHKEAIAPQAAECGVLNSHHPKVTVPPSHRSKVTVPPSHHQNVSVPLQYRRVTDALPNIPTKSIVAEPEFGICPSPCLRPPPRVPDFLRESLQRDHLLSATHTPEDDLRDVCDRLRRFRADRKRLKALRAQLKSATGGDAAALQAELLTAQAAVRAVDQNALLDRAKDLVRALTQS